MNNNNLILKNYLSLGYTVINNEIKKKEIEYLRKLILINYYNNNKKNYLSFQCCNEELQSLVIKFLTNNLQSIFLNNLELESNTKISVLPRIHIMINYHVNRLKSPGVGWHRDCGGEFKYKYCSNLLSKKEYVFGKIGIYLQNNSNSIGGGIDLIPKSSYYIKNNLTLKRKILGLKIRIIIIMQKFFSIIYKLFNENFFMHILKAIKIDTNPGNMVFFDSRTIHRGSPFDERLTNKFRKINDFCYDLPDEIAKISIYFQFGSSTGTSSYFYDRIRRQPAETPEMWKKEIELYKKYSTELYEKSLHILNNSNLEKILR